jgi:hypothetical protein
MKTSLPTIRLTFALGAVGAAACSQAAPSAIVDDRALFRTSTRVEVQESGGFAALETDWVVDQESGRYLMTRRRICQGATCPPAMDSTSGTLDRAAADSLFAAIARDTTGLSAADFGTTRNGADMISYVLRVGVNGDTRIDARADDGTMPPPMYRIIQAVRATVTAARK